MYPVLSTLGTGFLGEWKKWLRLSTFVNTLILYEVVDTMYFMLCQRCQP